MGCLIWRRAGEFFLPVFICHLETRLCKEHVAVSNLKTFCAGLQKKLAPSILKDTDVIRRSSEACTLRRVTHSGASAKQKKTSASAAESALLKALDINLSDLAAMDTAVEQLRGAV